MPIPTAAPTPMAVPQWSHRREAVETREREGKVKRFTVPQWSHGREAVETRFPEPESREVHSSRNGATAVRPWRHGLGGDA